MSATRTFALVTLLAAGTTTAARAQDAVEVTASALNVRSGPGTTNGVLGLARRGQVYAALARQGGWVRVQFGERAGWSHGGYLRPASAQVLTVDATALNVRSGASTRYRVLGQLARGARVAVTGQSGEWRRIDFEGQAAWVHGAYLTAPGAAPRPVVSHPRSSAGFIQLPASGPGFRSAAVAARRWGTPRLIYGIERIGARWVREQPGAPRMTVKDISFENGGPISGHASHQRGVDADVWPVRSDAGEDQITRFHAAYSRTRTQALIRLYRDELSVTHVFFNDPRVTGVQEWPNHDNHFHVRIR